MSTRLFVALFAIASLAAVVLSHRVRLAFGESMPKGVYRIFDCDPEGRSPLRRGDVVGIAAELAASNNSSFEFFRSRGWMSQTGRPTEFVLKQVAGVSGDAVAERDGQILVNGVSLGSDASFRATTVRTTGETLPQVSFPTVVRAGQVWVTSPNKRGIDSRYFGGIDEHAVACRAERVWAL